MTHPLRQLNRFLRYLNGAEQVGMLYEKPTREDLRPVDANILSASL